MTSQDISKPILVMIVDDIPENIQVLGNILRNNNYQIAFATNGAQALKIAKAKTPDIILLDVNMPEMDGFEVCKELKKIEETKDIPVIFLTARTEVDDVVEGLSAGAVDYLTKPFNQKELFARLATHIELKRSRELILTQKEELARIAEELKEENKAKDKFFSIMSHDLRSPFSGILGLAEMLYSSNVNLANDEKIETEKLLHQSLLNQYRLLENLLEWGRLRINRIALEPQDEIISDIIDTTISFMEGVAISKNISLINESHNELCVFADVNLVSTVIRNLISNSLKFTNEGGSITISAEDIEDSVKITVKDTGIGMSQERIAQLFKHDSHFTTKGTNNEPGTGLGLMIVKEIIKNSGGILNVESVIGQGSSFSFTLPKGDINKSLKYDANALEAFFNDPTS